MNLFKKIVLVSALSTGISNADTAPCNGFKIDFKNSSHQNLILDKVHFVGALINTTDPGTVEVNKNLIFTVNQSTEGGAMRGEFLFHSATEPLKELKLAFSLTNKKMICEINNFSQQGTLVTKPHRLLGGVFFSVKD